MRAICIANDIGQIDPGTAMRLRTRIRVEGPLTELQIGGEYAVFALAVERGEVLIFLHTVEDLWFPSPFPIELFRLSDSSLGSDWVVRRIPQTPCDLVAAPPIWSEDPTFYERLVAGDQEAVSWFRRLQSASSG